MKLFSIRESHFSAGSVVRVEAGEAFITAVWGLHPEKFIGREPYVTVKC
jgi:hypothetical protein